MGQLKIKELKELIKNLPDEMSVYVALESCGAPVETTFIESGYGKENEIDCFWLNGDSY